MHFLIEEKVQELQFALHRNGEYSRIGGRIGASFCFRKKAQKVTDKCPRGLKQIESIVGSQLVLDVD